MQPKFLILTIAALHSANVLASPVALKERGVGAPVEFQASSYRPIYREAEEAGLVEKEKRGAGAPVEFQASTYRPIYREAKDAGLAEEKRSSQ